MCVAGARLQNDVKRKNGVLSDIVPGPDSVYDCQVPMEESLDVAALRIQNDQLTAAIAQIHDMRPGLLVARASRGRPQFARPAGRIAV